MTASAVQEDNVITKGKDVKGENADSADVQDSPNRIVSTDVKETMEAKQTVGAQLEVKLDSNQLTVSESSDHFGNNSSNKACTLDKNFGSEVNRVEPRLKSPHKQHRRPPTPPPAKAVDVVSSQIDKMANDLVMTVIRTALVELLASTSIKDSVENIRNNFESGTAVDVSGIESDPVEDSDDCDKVVVSDCEVEDNVVTQVVSEVIASSKTSPLRTPPLEKSDPPLEIYDTPSDVSNAPLDTSDSPLDTSEPLPSDPPLEISDAPLDSSDPPLDTSDPPLDISDTPLDTSDPPLDIYDTPCDICDEPPLDPPLDPSDVLMMIPKISLEKQSLNDTDSHSPISTNEAKDLVSEASSSTLSEDTAIRKKDLPPHLIEPQAPLVQEAGEIKSEISKTSEEVTMTTGVELDMIGTEPEIPLSSAATQNDSS